MEERGNFASVLKALKTPEARAAVIYDLFKSRAKVSEIIDPIPPGLEDGVRAAVGIAFSSKDYKTGFVIAEQGGILEEVIQTLDNVPVRIGWNQEIPEGIKQIPGYKEPEMFTGSETRISEANDLIVGIRTGFIREYLIPNQEFRRASEQLIKLGENQKAAEIALVNLEIEEAAEICELANCGFSNGIRIAREQKKSDLEKRLKLSHINSVKTGKIKDWTAWSLHGNYMRAVTLATQYGFESGDVMKLVDEGIRSSMSGFEEKLKHRNTRVRELRHLINDWNREASEHKRKEVREEEERLRDARLQYASRVDESVDELRELVKVMPEDASRVEAIKGTLLKACEDYDSVFDAFSISRAFGDLTAAAKYGSQIVSASEHNWWTKNTARAVREIIEERILDKVDVGLRKKYVDAVMWSEREHGGGNVAEVAKKWGLSEYLMQQFESSGNYGQAGRIAASLGNSVKAKELFARGKFYESAAEQTDSGLEKSVFYLQSLTNKIDWRCRYPSTYSDMEKTNEEIEIMRNAVGLCDNKNSLDYISAVSQVFRAMVRGKEYSKACLFADESDIAVEVRRGFVRDDYFKEAEHIRDFAGCYHLARLSGRDENVTGYKILALQLKQKIPEKLDDFVYVRPAIVEKHDNGEVDF